MTERKRRCAFCGYLEICDYQLNGEPMCTLCADSDDWEETPDLQGRIVSNTGEQYGQRRRVARRRAVAFFRWRCQANERTWYALAGWDRKLTELEMEARRNG